MPAVLHVLTDPWSDPVGRRALFEVVLLGLTGGALSCWIVFYNLSYSAESLAHALLPGLVIAALIGAPLMLGGAVGLLVAALAVAAAGQVPAIGRDTSVAVVVTTLFGAGVLLALSPSSPPGLGGLLFGDVLGVSNTDLVLAGALAVVVLVALVLLHGRLLAVGFDRISAPSAPKSARPDVRQRQAPRKVVRRPHDPVQQRHFAPVRIHALDRPPVEAPHAKVDRV